MELGRLGKLTALLVVALLVLAGCGAKKQAASTAPPKATPSSSASSASSSPTPSPTPTPTSAPTSTPTSGAGPTKVLVVIEENHSLKEMREGMPFLAGLSDTYGYATHWNAIMHPSEPNYLAIAGGSTFGVTDDKAPGANSPKVGSAPSVFDQALAAGKTAATYADAMPDNCHVYDAPADKPTYAVRHNPWVFFSAGRDSCLKYDQPLDHFASDAAADQLPNVGFLIPDLVHDAHNASLGDADAWLKQQLSPVISSSDFTSGRLVVVVTADEDDRKSGNIVLTSVLSTQLHHKVVDTPLTHYSLTRFIDDVLGVPPLGQGKDAPDMKAAFGL